MREMASTGTQDGQRGTDTASLHEGLVALARELIGFMQHHAGDPDLGADIAQDALAQAVQSLERLRDPTALRGWVYRIAINRFNDHIRRSMVLRTEDPSLAEGLAASGSGPVRQALVHELDDVLRQELLCLPERQRTVLMLHGVRGMTQPEIARLLSISADAVKMSLFHARQKMRVRLEAYMAGNSTNRDPRG